MASKIWDRKGTKEDKERSKQIEEQLKADRRRQLNEVKLLLLGTGESGKSTVAKQMKIIHLRGFSDKEKEIFAQIIQSNVVQGIQDLIEGARKLTINLDNQELADRVGALQPLSQIVHDRVPVPVFELTPALIADIKALWADVGIKEAFKRQSEFQINDSVAYFISELDRVSVSSFVPNDQDMLRARVRTTGVQETHFELDNMAFRVVDVGGQRGERAKWIQCFDSVTAIVFCVALSEYDMKLREEESVNRMHESLNLFDEICNNKWLKDIPMILFLNKKDIFMEKIAKTDLNVCFDDYTDGCDFDKASKFVKKKFEGVNRQPKEIYSHVTVATDTSNIRLVFNAVKDIILNKGITEAGLNF